MYDPKHLPLECQMLLHEIHVENKIKKRKYAPLGFEYPKEDNLARKNSPLMRLKEVKHKLAKHPIQVKRKV
jgi:hypothetical protein